MLPETDGKFKMRLIPWVTTLELTSILGASYTAHKWSPRSVSTQNTDISNIYDDFFSVNRNNCSDFGPPYVSWKFLQNIDLHVMVVWCRAVTCDLWPESRRRMFDTFETQNGFHDWCSRLPVISLAQREIPTLHFFLNHRLTLLKDLSRSAIDIKNFFLNGPPLSPPAPSIA